MKELAPGSTRGVGAAGEVLAEIRRPDDLRAALA
jgi:hypothetical protein